ncbi:PDZ domain-containing protein [Cytobacillus depressus]|uniref:C-terminal processing peptidase n=1 Tax=Cytobacillus depressus TaxID=1602942 RepID=A0A6L3V6I3_9BACI|nr:S41 family peptidase [Cytobacillus depressus]KAB2336856.1 PDZ domain-containing protein [Cytobacillus depressus]
MNRKWLALLMTGSLLMGAGGTYVGMTWLHGGVFIERPNKNEAHIDEGAPPSAIGNVDLGKVEQAYSLIFNSYVEKVEESQLVEGAIQGMLATLSDPYSVYMNKETVRQFNETLESSFEGIGAEVGMDDGKIIIISPFKESPAEKAGLKSRDQILKVDGKSIKGMDLFQATSKIRGKKGTKVKLEIARSGLKEPLIVNVKRDEIPQITVNSDLKMQNGKSIGYLEITSFSEDTAKEFKENLNSLEEKGIDSLLIDVRGNPGGLLVSVEKILKELVTEKKPYIQIENRQGKKKPYFSNLKERKDYPIAVLIDKGSASASEILAGALHEAEGYALIGEKTFGKGTVQQPFPMGDGSNIKLTFYKWLTPDGNWIHNEGIKPTLEVKQPKFFQTHPLQIEEALVKDMNNEQVRNAQEILAGLGFSPGRSDGYFSESTENAVRAFQQGHKLNPTGKIDRETASALEQAVVAEMKKEENDMQLQLALRYLARQ